MVSKTPGHWNAIWGKRGHLDKEEDFAESWEQSGETWSKRQGCAPRTVKALLLAADLSPEDTDWPLWSPCHPPPESMWTGQAWGNGAVWATWEERGTSADEQKMLRGLAPHSLCGQTLSRIVSDGRMGNRGLSYSKQITESWKSKSIGS